MGLPPNDLPPWPPGGEPAEESLIREINYCKARLVDMETAPSHSRHREGRSRVLCHYARCEELLRRLRQGRR